ncbi:MAG TPA: glycosyltransferase family 39 protein [Stellaceae bacterium]|nr:glycosyltransferase family 39 protein [Stellaceae bacterium]
MTVRSDRVTRRDSAADDRARQVTLFVVLMVTLVRCAWLMLDRADLYPDEAQYWIWSLHPAFGYYSKPPVVAWLIAATTALFGGDPAAVRIAAPLLHFGTSLIVYQLAERLYDARTGQWSAIAYATLPGVSASAVIISTDAPMLFCWAVALYAFVRAREPAGGRWWIMVGIAAGVGLLSRYTMAFWPPSALLYLLLFRDERRHVRYFLGAMLLALVIYSPNFLWNWAHDFASYRHTRDNGDFGGPLFHPAQFFEFLGEQCGVFGPIFFASLIAIVALARRSLADRRAALLATFALPSLAIMLVVSFLSRAQANWSAPTFVSAVVLVVAWLLAHNRRSVVIVSVVLDVVIAVVAFGAHDAAPAFGVELPARLDPLHRLRGWGPLGRSVAGLLARHPGTILMSDDREVMAALVYYVEPHPLNALKWNGDCTPDGRRLPHDEFDLTVHPERYIGDDFMLVAKSPDNVERILSRFAHVDPLQQDIYIPLDRKTGRRYRIYWLSGFKGYRSCTPVASPKS